MKLRWLRSPNTTTKPDVLQFWVPGWGIEVIDGEHGYWEDVPLAIADRPDSSPSTTNIEEPGHG